MFNLNELKQQEILKKREDAMYSIRVVLEKEVFAIDQKQLACLARLSVKTIKQTVPHMPDVHVIDGHSYWLKRHESMININLEPVNLEQIVNPSKINVSASVLDVLRKNLDGITNKELLKQLDINMYQLNNSLKYLRKRYQIVREDDKIILKDCVAQIWPIDVEEDRTLIAKAILTKHDIERLLCKSVGLNQVE